MIAFLAGYFLPRTTNLISYGLYPFFKLQQIVADPIKIWFTRKKNEQIRQEEYERMQGNLEQLEIENGQLKATLNYCAAIEELHRFKQRYNDPAIKIAHVMVRHFSERDHYFLIDVGSSDGIEEQMVVTYANNLVGKISKVYPWYSKVMLITDRQCKVAAYDYETKSCGIHEGTNEDLTALTRVSHLAPVNQGDLIMSSGEGEIFPQGFVLGRIAEVMPDGLLHKIMITPALDLKSVRYCAVLPRAYSVPVQGEIAADSGEIA